ncbi:acyl-CoA dehydrogenase [Acinetobacter indicus]|uniref:acyl-CoA dehydrogenase n=1 Tax=Acinetobacter indicus TaxID=756892 RepID=UPI00257671F8|nr:acyl-CoA dehydrogenase [Acinetobacter indicus]MDM1309719.1 acyl-CoA dehydrogenase [Acinetobacter indicus]
MDQILAEFEQQTAPTAEDYVTTLRRLLAVSPEFPHPGRGQTLLRWQLLAKVAATDLTLVKWLESHFDALSILNELQIQSVPAGWWAVWAAEGHPQPVQYEQGYCSGYKAWCSAAYAVDFCLMTYRGADGQSQLLMVEMQKPSIQVDDSSWQAIGMQQTATATVHFQHTPATRIAQPGDYLNRPGFWHGAAGVAACWYGATVRLAEYLQQHVQQKTHAYHELYLGEVSTRLAVTRQFFTHVAAQIDAAPAHSHELIIRMLRAQVEDTALLVLEKVGKALGARPFCEQAHFARLAADLPVFLRQSHAAFDLAAIGRLSLQEGQTWQL